MDTMTCSKCHQTKPSVEFYAKTGRQRKNSRCISCYRQQQNAARAERRKDPEFRKREYRNYVNTFGGRAQNLYQDIKRRAHKKGLAFDLTTDWLVERLEKCEVTGIPLVLARIGDNKTHPFAPSVDRIDPAKGYTQDNCQVVCWMYNACRNYHDHSDVVKFARAVLEAEAKRTRRAG